MPTPEQRTVFSRLLKDARTHAGLGVGELADRVQVHRNAVSDWESGKSAPRRDRCAQLEDVLGLKPGQLSRHLGFHTGDVTPEAAIHADPHLTPEHKATLLAHLAEARRQSETPE